MHTQKFSEVVVDLHNYINPKTNQPAPMIADDVFEVVQANAERLDNAIVYSRDFDYNYFGFKTLERSYLLRINKYVPGVGGWGWGGGGQGGLPPLKRSRLCCPFNSPLVSSFHVSLLSAKSRSARSTC